MKKILFFVLIIVLATSLLACSQGQYQVKTSFPGDEAWVIAVCWPSNVKCTAQYAAEPVFGTGEKAPPVGSWCRIVDVPNNILDCGKKYFRIRILIPPV